MSIKELIRLELQVLALDIDESKIELYILKVTSKILNYCHLEKLPDNLNETVSTIVIEMIQNDISKAENDRVKSIQEGDTSISFETKKETTNEDIFNKHYSALNGFRKFSGFK